MTFGEYIKHKREALGWTQPEAANQAGIEQSYLSKLETGKAMPSEEIFSKLAAIYEIDTDEMTALFSLNEVNRLKEIKAVRTAILDKQKNTVKVTRGWLVAGLASLMIGAACLGFALIPNTAERLYHYRSEGVLKPGEELRAYSVLRDQADSFSGKPQEKAAFLYKQKEMLKRLDQHDLVLWTSKGDDFVEETPEGKRFYDLYDQRVVENPNPFKWFLVPALMFLFGSLGCFIVSFKWS
ncbi:helix-turn-helix domain-containing protein [Marinicella sp. W31]|uniref:helix-turn-helix domain-containing protein n=1 Tax=Marinicella sp. W31 TaxID=3023713 RepID=UPI00375653F2